MQSEGLIDTNVFIHALREDERSHECRAFLELLRVGERRLRLEPYIVHELTFVIGRVLKQMSREETVDFIREIIEWPGIECERGLLSDALVRWQRPGIAFADALLATQAQLDGTVVFTVNAEHFADLGVAASLLPES